MSEYFFLSEKIKQDTAFAYTEGKTPLSHELISKVKGETELPFELSLKKVTSGKDGLHISNDISYLKHLWLDYQPNNLSWPLMSQKLKDVISENLTGKEFIIWISAKVKSESETRIYFIPCFERKMDVLDEQKTIFVPGTKHIIKPIFSLKKISDFSLFHKPQDFWEITSGLYVSEALKKAIQKEKLSGLDFEKISVS